MLSQKAFYQLRREHMPGTGATKAYHESQSRIFSTDAPQFVGAGEGTDNLDFLADLSALKVINPDAIHREAAPSVAPVPESPSPLLTQLTKESIPYAHCAWCTETPKTRSMLEEHYHEIHHVVLQPSCCAPPSVFQTIMGMELQLRQANFGSFSQGRVPLRTGMLYEGARDIVGAMCAVREDTHPWSLNCFISWMMHEPTDPVRCLPDQYDPFYWFGRQEAAQCQHGGPGPTVNFWAQSSYINRLTFGVKI